MDVTFGGQHREPSTVKGSTEYGTPRHTDPRFEFLTDYDDDVSHLIKETVINHPEPHHLIANINL